MKSVPVDRIGEILKKHGIEKIDSERKEMLKIGCQLHTLTEEDVVYIASPSTGINRAIGRLSQCRLSNL